jgi:hypothetical protein
MEHSAALRYASQAGQLAAEDGLASLCFAR